MIKIKSSSHLEDNTNSKLKRFLKIHHFNMSIKYTKGHLDTPDQEELVRTQM